MTPDQIEASLTWREIIGITAIMLTPLVLICGGTVLVWYYLW